MRDQAGRIPLEIIANLESIDTRPYQGMDIGMVLGAPSRELQEYERWSRKDGNLTPLGDSKQPAKGFVFRRHSHQVNDASLGNLRQLFPIDGNGSRSLEGFVADEKIDISRGPKVSMKPNSKTTNQRVRHAECREPTRGIDRIHEDRGSHDLCQ